MSSTPQVNSYSFKADGVIAKGSVVKPGTDREHVAIASAATDKAFGIAQTASAAAEETIEIALPGGGAKALAGGSISAGDLLASDANGALVATTTANNRVVAVALEDAASGDLFACHVMVSNV